MATVIHPTAVVDAGATIGEGTRIWHFCHVMPTAVIGSNCIIGQNVYVDNNAIIGNGVKIQNNVSVYNGVEIEDEAFIGPSAVFTNVINPRSFIERKTEFKKILVKRGATIGANATIVCGISIGEYALVGAGSVVTKDVPPYALVTGNPARQKGWMSRQGYKLQFDAAGLATCPGDGSTYRLSHDAVTIIPSPNP
ncbi:MAG: N-acetyltransferase [Chitinophagaceae bacterium]|nr:N-acetyltransferase [Chitinophagaceae bacterium]MBL0055584.1 N-acetyltransferase [Chitinophagaceae bacterium]